MAAQPTNTARPLNAPRCAQCAHFLKTASSPCEFCSEVKVCNVCLRNFQHGAWNICSCCREKWTQHRRDSLPGNVFRMDTCGKCHRRDHAGWKRINGVLTCSYCRNEHPMGEY